MLKTRRVHISYELYKIPKYFQNIGNLDQNFTFEPIKPIKYLENKKIDHYLNEPWGHKIDFKMVLMNPNKNIEAVLLVEPSLRPHDFDHES